MQSYINYPLQDLEAAQRIKVPRPIPEEQCEDWFEAQRGFECYIRQGQFLKTMHVETKFLQHSDVA